MAKNNMRLKYKPQKRERNKNNNVETTTKDSAIYFGKVLVGVLIFIGVMYLIMIGMKKIGLFDAGYKKPTKEATTISYEYIPVSTVFNRSDKEYYVLFDDYSTNFTSDPYINELLSKDTDKIVYKVDTSLEENKVVVKETSNSSASSVDELSINDITLMRITNGKNTLYLTGIESIEGYLVNND